MAKNSFRKFAINMRTRGAAVERNSGRLTRETANVIAGTVVTSTPADVGTAKSNWQAGVNNRPTGTIPAYSPGSKGSSAGINERAAIDRARTIIASYKPGNTVHLTNNLPYIGLLNDGYSAQAPAGFVERALLAGKEFLRRRRKLSEG